MTRLSYIKGRIASSDFCRVGIYQSRRFFVRAFGRSKCTFLNDRQGGCLNDTISCTISISLLSVGILFIRTVLYPLRRIIRGLRCLFQYLIRRLGRFMCLVTGLVLVSRRRSNIVRRLREAGQETWVIYGGKVRHITKFSYVFGFLLSAFSARRFMAINSAFRRFFPLREFYCVFYYSRLVAFCSALRVTRD